MSRYIELEKASEYVSRLLGVMPVVVLKVFEKNSIDIVRCSECKYCHYEQENDVYHCYKLFHRFYDANKHFCSYGERKEDE